MQRPFSPSPVLRRTLLLLIAWSGSACLQAEEQAASDDPPNLVVIFIDDLGYADIGPFGAKDYATPNLDRMAAEGRKFTDFVTSTAVCSASRAALLTGCYHVRVGIHGALGPAATHGLNPDEVTLAELCKQKNYATACFGKWHLGDEQMFLPLQQGFDHYYGLPYSNDMWPSHPAYAKLPDDHPRRHHYPPLPLYEDNQIIDAEVTGEDQKQLTTAYTERAVSFIKDHAGKRPFFLYLPHSMVHVPLYVSDKFAGKSGAGLFGDVVMEVDWSVGQILDTLKLTGVDDNTLVIFTSDNGPWLSYGDHAGSAAPLREGKGTMLEGGYRVSSLMRWPGKIPPGTTCDELCSTIDIFPTVARLIDAKLPDHPIDGKDIRPLMFGEPDAQSPHEAFYCYYGGGQLQAVRDRRWKLLLPHRYRTLNGRPGGKDGIPTHYEQATITQPELYDLKQDPGETRDVAAEHPEVVASMQEHAQTAREMFGDRLSQPKKGKSVRPAGQLPKPPPGN